jgi:hypothetical protein
MRYAIPLTKPLLDSLRQPRAIRLIKRGFGSGISFSITYLLH